MEEEKKIVYQIILDIWDLAKKFVFQPLDDNAWNRFIYEANKVSNKYKKHDEKTQRLFSDIYFAIEKYKTAMDKELADK